MLFNSFGFIWLFLPTTFAGMFLLARYSHRLAALWLVVASLLFYSVWDFRFVVLLLGSIIFNYVAGYWIGLQKIANRTRCAKVILVSAIVVDLLILGYFKYANFFIRTVSYSFGANLGEFEILLPLGISFFTFTQIAFLVDVNRGIAREYNFIHYMLFITWFPHLIAGPVLHHKQMMPQFSFPETWRINPDHVAIGITVFVLGLAKKVMLADNLALIAKPVFASASESQWLSFADSWMGVLAYSLQLYFDFSGYSDMAIGLSLMFNVRLPLNFDSPYKATSIIDFWRRWHISLSDFLRDYLYFPLGGNRRGALRRYLNLLTTMLLGGLWHGAGWTFVVWGGLHGVFLVVNHCWRSCKVRLGWGDGGRCVRVVSGLLTFMAVAFAWVFFRAENMDAALRVVQAMSGQMGFHGAIPRDSAKVIFISLLIVWVCPNVRQIMRKYKICWNDVQNSATVPSVVQSRIVSAVTWKPTPAFAFVIAVLFLLVSDRLSRSSEFLYFQF